MAYEPTLDDVLNSLYGSQGDIADDEIAQLLGKSASSYTGGRGKGPESLYIIRDRLIEKGLPPHVAAGIVGGLMQESGGRTGVTNSIGAYGAAQWLGDRLHGGSGYTGLIPYSKMQGMRQDDPRLQADYIVHELQGPEHKALQRMLATSTPEEAAIAARKYYERPGVHEANDPNRIKWANTFYGTSPSAAQPSQPTQPQLQTITLSDGSTVDVEPGADMAALAAALKDSGIDAEPMRQVALPDGSYVDAPYSYSDEQVLEGMRQATKPTVADESKKGHLAAGISSFESGVGSALRGLGGAGEYLGQQFDSPMARAAGEYLTGKGQEWSKKGQEAYEPLTPEEVEALGPMGKVRKYATEPLAGFGGSALATIPAMALPGGAAARIGAFTAQELGGQLERQEAEGQTADIEKAAPWALASGVVQNNLLGPLKYVNNAFGKPAIQAELKRITETEGAEAARDYAKGLATNVLKEAGINTSEVIGSETLSSLASRAAAGLDLASPEALEEYKQTAIESAPGGLFGVPAGFGRHAVQQGVIEGTALSQKIKQADEQRRLDAEAADIESREAAQKRQEAAAELERQAGIGVEVPSAEVNPPVQEPVAPPTELVAPPVPPSVAAAPPAEVAPVPVQEVTPEVTPEAPKHWAEEILGLKPSSGLVKKIKAQGLDVDNPAHAEAIQDAVNKSSAKIAPEAYTALDQRLEAAAPPILPTPEVQTNAIEIPKTGAPVLGSSPQPVLRQEGRDQTISGEGVVEQGREERPAIQSYEKQKTQKTNKALAPISRRIDTVLTKLFPDSVATNAKLRPNLSDAKAISEQGFDSLNIDRQSVVLNHVLSMADNPKVTEAIIESIPIDMMDMLRRQEVTPEKLRHNPAVLRDLLTSSDKVPIPGFASSVIENMSRRAASISTRATAEKPSLRGKASSAELPSDFTPAIKAEEGVLSQNISPIEASRENIHRQESVVKPGAPAPVVEAPAVPITPTKPKRVSAEKEAKESVSPQAVLAKKITDLGTTLTELHGQIKAENAKPRPNSALLSQFEARRKNAEQLLATARRQQSQLLQASEAKRVQEAEVQATAAREEAARKVKEQGGYEWDILEAEKEIKKAEAAAVKSASVPTAPAKSVKQKLREVPEDGAEAIIKRLEEMEAAKTSQIKEAKTSSTDKYAGVRYAAPADYTDTTNARDLVTRFKEKGTDPELVKLMDTINASPHLGSVSVNWVKEGDTVPPAVAAKFNKGEATALASWDKGQNPTLYFKDAPDLREDVIAHETVHAVTEAAIKRNPETAKELSGLAKQIGYSLSEQAGFEHNPAKDHLRDFWKRNVADDPSELLAYGLTSPMFREALNQYGADGKPFKAYRTEAELNALRKGKEKPEKVFTAQAPKELTLWDKFVDAIAKLFGLPTKRKAEFKRQLDEYLDKKAKYEEKVKDYNTLRPLQERLDTVFKDFLRETSKKGVVFEETEIKEAKEEKPLVKESEPESVVKEGIRAATDVMKKGAWTHFEGKLVNRHAFLEAFVKDMSTFEDGKLRSDLQASVFDQIYNTVSAGVTEGIPVFSKDDTVIIQKDQKRNLSNITKAIDKLKVKNPRIYFSEIARALRGEEILKEDIELQKKINTLSDKAQKLEAHAKTLSYAEGKKHAALAKQYKEEARKLQSRIGEEGREKLVTEEHIAEARRRLEEHPEIQPILDDIHGLMKSLVDLWEASGLVSKDVAKEWRSKPSYIPLYMAQEDLLRDPSKAVKMMGGGVKSLPNVKRLKGGTQAINLLENLNRHYAFMTTAAAQNMLRKNAAKDMELFGSAQRTNPEDKQAIMFKEGGKEVYYRVADPMALEAMQAASIITDPILKAAREYTKVFRAVTLINPLYWYRQLIRDPLHANVVSKTGIVTPVGAAISFAKIIANASKEYGELKRRGIVGAVDALSDPARFKRTYDKNPGIFRKGADWVMHVHEAADAATRVEVYKAGLKEAKQKGMSGEDAKNFAAMRAREIINFAHQGSAQSLQAIRATVPFFSAALNSLNSVARAATGKGLNKAEAAEARRLFTSRALMIASYTTAYALAMQDDEDYLKSPDAVNNWLIPTGDKDKPFWMIPLPFELGFVTKVMPELMVRLNSGTLRPYEAKKMLKEAAFSTLVPPLPFPQLAKPLVEAALNVDMHTGRQIVGAGQARLAPSEQTRGASALSIELGRQLGLSPVQVEHFMRGYLTELWTTVGVMSDAFLPAGAAKEERYSGEIPTIIGGGKGIVTVPEKDRAVDTFYELHQAATQIKDSITSAEHKGDFGAMDRILNDPELSKKFYAAPAGRDIAEQMSKVETAISQIRNSSLSKSEKREQIREYRNWYNELAERGVSLYNSLGIEEP